MAPPSGHGPPGACVVTFGCQCHTSFSPSCYMPIFSRVKLLFRLTDSLRYISAYAHSWHLISKVMTFEVDWRDSPLFSVDVPSRNDPSLGEWLHWGVTNISFPSHRQAKQLQSLDRSHDFERFREAISRADVLQEYSPPRPHPGKGSLLFHWTCS